jgi:hypothetical protein
MPLYSRVPTRLSRYDRVNHHCAELIGILSNATTARKVTWGREEVQAK